MYGTIVLLKLCVWEGIVFFVRMCSIDTKGEKQGSKVGNMVSFFVRQNRRRVERGKRGVV